jgi:Ca2+-binding EF-hand superfamily protein
VLKRPDADYQLAFSVFDTDNSGSIDFDEFKHVLSTNIAASEIRTLLLSRPHSRQRSTLTCHG